MLYARKHSHSTPTDSSTQTSVTREIWLNGHAVPRSTGALTEINTIQVNSACPTLAKMKLSAQVLTTPGAYVANFEESGFGIWF